MELKILFLLLVKKSVFGDRTIIIDVDQYHTCLPMLMRPEHTRAVPSQNIQLFGETLPATRHHVIPYSTLCTFFNLVLEENPMRNEFGRYLAMRVREIYDFFEENDEAGDFLHGREPIMLHGDRNITVAGRSITFGVDNRMGAAFAWMPGNLFYGPPPERRADDPGEGFEVNAEKIVGSPAFAVLRRIYDSMQNYINNPSQRTNSNIDIIFADLIEVHQTRNTPYEFDPRDWVVNANAVEIKFYIKRRTEHIEELPHQHDGSELRKRAVRSAKSEAAAAFISSITDDNNTDVSEDYWNAAKEVCQEYAKHFNAKLNSYIRLVAIAADVDVIFVYSINNNNFVYGQSRETLGWFIKEVKQDGSVGKLTDRGIWNYYYDVQFPYQINGKQYFYGHNLGKSRWFTQELKSNGTMGKEIEGSFWRYSYLVQFPICINGQQYFYGQNMNSKYWFLQELKSDGTVGLRVSYGDWIEAYDIQFPFNVGDKQYFGGHNTESKSLFIRDIASDNLNSMGKRNVSDHLDNSYSVLFPFSFGGKTYLFGHNPDKRRWFLREMFGSVVEQNTVDFAFDIAYPFNVNGYQYFYGRNKNDYRWSVMYFDLKENSNL